MEAVMVEDRFSNEEMRRDPYAFYAELRDDAPVFRSEYLGAYVITRFDDVRFVLDNPAIFSSFPPANQTKALAKYASDFSHLYAEAGVHLPLPTLVVTDGLVHKRYRSLVESTFSMSGVRKQEAIVEKVIDDLIGEFIDLGAVDLYRDFCLKVPLYVICDMMGLPRSGAVQMQKAGEASIRLSAGAGEDEQGLLEAHRTIVAFQTYIQPFVDAARAEPGDNLLGHFVRERTIDGDFLSDREILSLVQVLNVGGNETTTNGLGNMFEKLLNDPAIEQRLRAERNLIPRFVEETVRLESPVCGMPRWATSDVEVGGIALKAGDALHIRFGAANRDESRFTCPADVDLQRPGIRNHVGFGSGPHYCLGAPLARFELRVALEHVFDQIESMVLDPAAPDINYGTKLQVRAVAALPILFEKRKDLV